MYKKIIVPVEMGQLEKGQKILAKAKALLDTDGEIVLLNVAENIPGYLTIDLPPDFIGNSVKEAEERLNARALEQGLEPQWREQIEHELALIGRAADRMAEQLQADRAVALHMSELVNRSPLVVIEWRNEPGWPVSYVSDSVSVWGYSPGDLLDGKLHYNELLHPDDLPWVNAELKTYFADGPDDYRQEYRIRRADGGVIGT